MTKRIQNIQLPITLLYCCVFFQILKSRLYPVPLCFKCVCILSIVFMWWTMLILQSCKSWSQWQCGMASCLKQKTVNWHLEVFFWNVKKTFYFYNDDEYKYNLSKQNITQYQVFKRSHVCRKGWNNKNKNKRKERL